VTCLHDFIMLVVVDGRSIICCQVVMQSQNLESAAVVAAAQLVTRCQGSERA